MCKPDIFNNPDIDYGEVFHEAFKEVANKLYKSEPELKKKVEDVKKNNKKI